MVPYVGIKWSRAFLNADGADKDLIIDPQTGNNLFLAQLHIYKETLDTVLGSLLF